MNKQREAMKLALEFVEYCWRDVSMNEWAREYRQRVEDSLEKALAEPEWVGLTDDEIATACRFGEHTAPSTRLVLEVISRAIEVKLKEKNT